MKNGLMAIGTVLMLMFSMGFVVADNHTNETNQTGTNMTDTNMTDMNVTDNNDTTGDEGTASVLIKEPYPRGLDYIFVCDTDVETDTFAWNFGDGDMQSGPEEVFHSYDAAGTFTVTCEATDGNTTVTAERTIVATGTSDGDDTGDTGDDGNETGNQTGGQDEGDATVNLFVKEWYPKNNHYVFVCDVNGMTPNSFSWWYGDGHKLLEISNGDTYHIYQSTGTYTVTCQANGDSEFPQDSMTITVNELGLPDNGVGGNDEGDQTNGNGNGVSAEMCSASATISTEQHNDRDYTFTCDDGTDMVPVAYVWDFGDGVTETGGAEVFHSYANTGDFTVHCAATDAREASLGQHTLSVTDTETGDQGDDTGDDTGDETGDDTGNETGNETGDETGNEMVMLSVESQQDLEFMFACEETGFTAGSFNIDAGDGTPAIDSETGELHYTYAEAGEYDVVCSAETDDGRTVEDTITVTATAADDNGDGDDNGDVTSLSATIEPVEGATTSASGTVSGTFDGETLLLDGSITGLAEGELDLPGVFLQSDGETLFAFTVEDLGTSADVALNTSLSEDGVAALLAGDLTVAVNTIDMAGAAVGELTVVG